MHKPAHAFEAICGSLQRARVTCTTRARQVATHVQAQQPQAQVNSTTLLPEQGLGGQTIDTSSRGVQQVRTILTLL